LNLAVYFEMSSGSGLITWGIQENTKRDDDTDEDAEDLEDLDVEETVVKELILRLEFLENVAYFFAIITIHVLGFFFDNVFFILND